MDIISGNTISKITLEGDTKHYKIKVNPKTKQCILDIPVKYAELETFDGQGLCSYDYKNIRLEFTADKIVPLEYLIMTYTPSAFHCWCVDWNYEDTPFIHIEVT